MQMQPQQPKVDVNLLEKRRNNYKKVFESDTGKQVLEELKKIFFFNMTTLQQGAMGTDPYKTAFNEGQRSVVVQIINTMNIDIEKIRQMQKGSKSGGAA